VRRATVALALAFLCSGLGLTQPQTRIKLLPDEERYFTVGLMGGVYFVQDRVFRDLYGEGSPFLGAEVTLRFPIREPHGMDIAAGGRTLRDKGLTSYTEEDISLRLTNLSLSLRYSYDTGRFALFLGPGIEYVMYKETYAETFPIDSVKASQTGIHLTGGGYVHLTSGLSLKGYFKYCRVETDRPGFRVNLGGTEWGAGILYRFYF
jgi:hypothetical protein